MRTLTAALMLAVVLSALPSPAGEAPAPAKPDSAAAKAARITIVEQEVIRLEKLLPVIDRCIEEARGNPRMQRSVKLMEKEKVEGPGKLEALKVELGWIRGQITVAGVETESKAAQAEADKAAEAVKAVEERAKQAGNSASSLEAVKAAQTTAAAASEKAAAAKRKLDQVKALAATDF